MELDAKIAYETALNRVLEKEKQIVELMALYTNALEEIKRLEKELEEYKKEELGEED